MKEKAAYLKLISALILQANLFFRDHEQLAYTKHTVIPFCV